MKRNIRRVLIGLACAAAALVLVGVQKYYPKYRDFREQTNYRFASIADFFYQLGEARLLSYQFSDQDVSDIEVGSQHIRTMEIVTSQGNMYLQAVAVKSAFGTYYRFLTAITILTGILSLRQISLINLTVSRGSRHCSWMADSFFRSSHPAIFWTATADRLSRSESIRTIISIIPSIRAICSCFGLRGMNCRRDIISRALMTPFLASTMKAWSTLTRERSCIVKRIGEGDRTC